MFGLDRELGAAPHYSRGLELTLSMLLRSMEPEDKLKLSRRMLEVFKHLEAEALEQLGKEDL